MLLVGKVLQKILNAESYAPYYLFLCRVVRLRDKVLTSKFLHMASQESQHNYYKLTPRKLGCEVRDIDLKKDVPPEGMIMIS